MFLVLAILILALVFEFSNGFHDTANAIATSVSTRVMTPRQAIILSTAFNLLGALAGTAVATTVGKGLVDVAYVTPSVVLGALIAAIAWNLLTWWWGLPSSSSHALIGGLCGAALASSDGRWSAIRWMVFNDANQQMEGLWPKVLKPMMLAPVFSLAIAYAVMGILFVVCQRWRPRTVKSLFGSLQWLSASWMSFNHGTNDAQKTMGIIALTLYTGTTSGALQDLPNWLGFLRLSEFAVDPWIKWVCAVTMAAGTAAGGWRIIATLGHKMVRLQPIHGMAAQASAAGIIQLATHWGMPLSTTHVISGSIMGVGATRRLNAVKWGVVERMAWAWILTLPVTGLLGYGIAQLLIHWVHG